jgi:uncharacterized protein HemX
MGYISALFSSVTGWLAMALVAAIIVGSGLSLWYRMEWKDCQAQSAAAIVQQMDIDKKNNDKSIADLQQKLDKNASDLTDATRRLANVQKTAVCGSTPAMRATHDELCRLFPSSEACH